MKKTPLIVLFVLIIFLLKTALTRHVYIPSPLEADRNFTRQEYLGEGLGKIYKNRFGVIYFNKIYPIQMKFNSIFFADLGSFFVFIPLYISLVYLGNKKFNEK